MKQNILIAMIVIHIFALAGCTAPVQEEKKDFSNEQITIYTSYDNEQSFYRFYGNYIYECFPDLDIRLITSVDEHKPDLIISHTSEFREMVEQSNLVDLNSFIMNSDFDKSLYSERIISALSDSTGVLHGLAPNVNIYGVFYNKQLLEEKKIDYPTDGMDWNELFQLAGQFTDGIVGFESTSVPSQLLMQVANTNEWYIFDDENIVFNRDEWTKAIQSILSLYASNSIAIGNGELFLEGESALYASHISYANQLSNTDKFAWGFVPSPVNTNMRSESQSVYFNQILSIPQDSTHKELAWEIVKALMGEDAVEYYENNQILSTASTLKAHMTDYKGVDLTAFWKQSIVPGSSILSDDMSTAFIDEYYAIFESQLQVAITENMSAEECLERIIEKINAAYEKERLRKS